MYQYEVPFDHFLAPFLMALKERMKNMRSASGESYRTDHHSGCTSIAAASHPERQLPFLSLTRRKRTRKGQPRGRLAMQRSHRPPPPPPPPLARKFFPPHWTVPLPLPPVLKAWRAVTSQWNANYRWNGASTSCGVVVVVVVDLMKMLPKDQAAVKDALVPLREAMELCHVYWQLYPPQVRELLKRKSPSIVEEIDHRGICVDVVGVEFELQVSGPDMRLLGDSIAPMLANSPDGVLFQRARDQLGGSNLARKTATIPIPIIINAILQEPPGTVTNWHVERFFSDIAAFAAYWTRIQVGGIHDNSSVGFRLNRIYISMDAVPITPWVVRRILELVGIQNSLVVFEKFSLDPRMVACSNNDTRRLVYAVTESSPQVLLSTGDVPSPNNFPPDKEEGEVEPLDRLTNLIHGILGALASAKSIGSLDISLLMLLLPRQHKPQLVWKALTSSLSWPPSMQLMGAAYPIEELVINAPIKLDNGDARFIRHEKQMSGKQRRLVKSVTIDVEEFSDSAILELVSLFVGLESITLSRHQGSFTAPFLSRLVKRAPRLHTIEIDRLKVDSAASLNELVHAAPWQSLSMTDVEVSEAPTVFKFLSDLGDPTCKLAKSLRVLRLSSRNNSTAVCNEAILMLSTALETNRVLQELHITVQNNVSPAAIAAVRCHRGDLLHQPQPRERAAFLSVLSQINISHPLRRIDDHIATTIFSFSAILRRRRVIVKLAHVSLHAAANDGQ